MMRHKRRLAAMTLVGMVAMSCQTLLDLDPRDGEASPADGAVVEGGADSPSSVFEAGVGVAEGGLGDASAASDADARPPTFCDDFQSSLLCVDFDDEKFFATYGLSGPAGLPGGVSLADGGVSPPSSIMLNLVQPGYLERSITTLATTLYVELDARCDLPAVDDSDEAPAWLSIGSVRAAVVFTRNGGVTAATVQLYRDLGGQALDAASAPPGQFVHIAFALTSNGELWRLDDGGAMIGEIRKYKSDASNDDPAVSFLLGTKLGGGQSSCYVDNVVVQEMPQN